jgi:hypothetical protein
MSGFEVAGVVLGSIPLIIVALEHYSQGVRDPVLDSMRLLTTLQLSTIRSMQKYEEVFEHLHASFVTIACIYRNTCEELLSPLALSDAQLYQLLEDHEASSWDSPKLNEALRNRLGSNYLPFKSLVKQLNKKLNLFGRKLQLCENFQVSVVECRKQRSTKTC